MSPLDDSKSRTTQRSGYIPEFDGLRAVAILMVMLFHLFGYQGQDPVGQGMRHVTSIGWSGVDLFFVLSGFLITGILLDSVNLASRGKNFYIRRSLRIFPLYYLVMSSVVAVGIIAPMLGFDLNDPAMKVVHRSWINFLYLTNFAKAFYGNDYVPLDIAWSLAIEEQFYLVFPFLVWHLKRKTLLRGLVLSVFIAPAFRVAVFLASGGAKDPSYVLPFSRMDALTLGALCVFVLRDGSPRLHARISSLVAPLWIAALACLLTWKRNEMPTVLLGYSLTALASAATVVRLMSGQKGWLAGLLSNRLLVHVGKVSYGLYLLHLLVRAAVDLGPLKPLFAGHAQDLGLAVARTLTLVLLSIGTASVSWYVFEQPILRLKDRWAPRERSPTV